METLLQKLLKLTRCFKASLDLDRLTSNVREILAIFKRGLNQCNTVLVIKCLNNVVKAHSYFPLRHLAPVVQTLDSPIRRIKNYPADKYYRN